MLVTNPQYHNWTAKPMCNVYVCNTAVCSFVFIKFRNVLPDGILEREFHWGESVSGLDCNPSAVNSAWQDRWCLCYEIFGGPTQPVPLAILHRQKTQLTHNLPVIQVCWKRVRDQNYMVYDLYNLQNKSVYTAGFLLLNQWTTHNLLESVDKSSDWGPEFLILTTADKIHMRTVNRTKTTPSFNDY